MNRSWRLRGAVPLTAALALVAAACGSDDGGGASTEAPSTEAADTTAAAETAAPTTEAAATSSAAPAAPAFQVPTDACPPEATTALADGEPIKLAFVGPQTGPLAAFGVIGQGMKVFFDKLNAGGGRRRRPSCRDHHQGRRLRPGQVGARRCRRRWRATRSSPRCSRSARPTWPAPASSTPTPACPRRWSAPASPTGVIRQNFPWTLGGIPSYTVESNVWTEFIKEKFPDATKVALLTFNNDFGKTYKTALEELLPAAGLGDRGQRGPRADLGPVQRGDTAPGGRSRTSSSAGPRRRSAPT